MTSLRLPIFDEEAKQDVMNFVADLHLGTVADEFGGGTSKGSDVLQGVDELFLCFHTKHICDKGIGPNNNLSNL